MNLRRKRHDLDMTQEELAERAGLSSRYVGLSSAATCRQASLCSGKLRKRWESNREICSGGLGDLPSRRPPRACPHPLEEKDAAISLILVRSRLAGGKARSPPESSWRR